MKITFLGTGTSQGVPIIGNNSKVSKSLDFRDKRLRSSILVSVDSLNIIIDTGPDFRQQMLRAKPEKVDAVLFTHEHKDHTAGMDDLRSFYFKQKKSIPIYAQQRVLNQLENEFEYIFAKKKYPGVLNIDTFPIESQPFFIQKTKITPIEVLHYKLPVFGYRINDFTYITDANYISQSELEKIKGSKVLVLNALQKEDHISHFTLAQALEVVQTVQPEKAYLTHISFKLGLHAEVSKELPKNVFLSYDGLEVEL